MKSGLIEEFARFLSAQARVYDEVLRELTAGRKDSHWMWFIFPQLRGLGQSVMSRRYAIVSLKQGRRYLEHELLGQRLRDCTALVIGAHAKTAEDIFGVIDALKFHSCLTLFSLCAPHYSVFEQGLRIYYGGRPDANTLRLLKTRGELPRSSEQHAQRSGENELTPG